MAIASRNSTTHGLSSHRLESYKPRDIIIDSPYFKEEISEYNYLLNSLTEELHPKGIFQKMLVQKIANCLWRSRRAIIAETAQINHQLAWTGRDIEKGAIPKHLYEDSGVPIYPFQNESERTASMAGRELIPEDLFCNNIMRYEMRLDRQLTRAYKLLRHLQIMDQCVEEPVVNE